LACYAGQIHCILLIVIRKTWDFLPLNTASGSIEILNKIGSRVHRQEGGRIDLGNLCPGTLITFLDKDTKESPDESGCNQIGILLRHNIILFVRKKKMIEKDINDLNTSKVFALPFKNPELASRVHTYFEANKRNRYLFTLGLKMLEQGERFFASLPIMPKLTTWKSDEEYEAAWNSLITKIEKADLIVTFNEKSLISRFIASLDKGSWSHSATYVGNGYITEAVRHGVVIRPLEVYKRKHVHIGIYRLRDVSTEVKEKVIMTTLAHVGSRYNYAGVIRLGLKLLLGLDLAVSKPGNITPNGLIYTGAVYLVGYL
jgi:hypothetical protein